MQARSSRPRSRALWWTLGSLIPGVLHISQLQKDPVKKVEDVLQEGQAVDVWVRRVRKDRIELTMIEPLRYDWKDMQPDMVVKGKVVRLETYGAFVDIGAERPGMIHISELARGYVKDAKDVVKEGDEVEAKILSVDAKKRQIRLSLKALQPEMPAAEPVEREINAASAARRPRRPSRSRKSWRSLPSLSSPSCSWRGRPRRIAPSQRANPAAAKRQRSADSEQEEILSRTLEKRVPTGA